MSAPASQARRVKPRNHRWFPTSLVLLALLLLGFEISVRLIQPDTLTYDASFDTSDFVKPVRHHVHMSVTDPRAVVYWQSAVNANPLPLSRYNSATARFVHCNGMQYRSPQTYIFTFTWHGLPLETATSYASTCGGAILRLTSGGLPDPRVYAIPEPLPNALP